MKGYVSKGLISAAAALLLICWLAPPALAESACRCYISGVDPENGYCSVRFELDKTRAGKVTWTMDVPGDLRYVSAGRIENIGGNRFEMSYARGAITYQFDPGLSYNPVITAANIQVESLTGESEAPFSQSMVLKLHTVHEHTFSFVEVIREATCTQKARERWRCSCGEETERDGEEYAPHTPADEWSALEQAACLVDGKSALLCANCGEALETARIPARGHHLEPEAWEITLQQTCAEPGEKVKNCADCGENLAKEEIPATGAHAAETTWRVEKAATCSEPGIEHLHCGSVKPF